jgi:HAD superfamily hydrolase (TIGR01459 family)
MTIQAGDRRTARLLAGLAELAPSIDVLICDVWGVVHDGQSAHPLACDALERLRAGGSTVVMVSNAPRPSGDVIAQMLSYGVTRGSFDAIITSGDVTRALIAERPGQPVFHIGPARDHGVYAGLDVAMVGPESADYCVCSGFADDEVETPADYADVLAVMARRGLTMICANPDLIVERGHRLIPCAGALAQAYEAAGGVVIYAGKPHRPVYERALEMATRLRGAAPGAGRVMAVGDALRTDVAGAAGMGLPSIFLLEGIHWADAGAEQWAEQYGPWLASQSPQPDFVMPRLSWGT